MDKKQNLLTIVLLITAACAIMAFIDAVLSPAYFIKSVIKLILFLAIPFFVLYRKKEAEIFGIMKTQQKKLAFSLLLGVAVYLFLLGAYYLIGPYFDFSNVTVALANNYGVKKENFIWVALYISFINSLLEEFFFRGVGFLILKKFASRRTAYLFSAAAFSLYHIAIMSSWFQPLLFILFIAGLFIAGLLFDWLDEKSDTIYTSWLVHMCANFSINTVGFILFMTS